MKNCSIIKKVHVLLIMMIIFLFVVSLSYASSGEGSGDVIINSGDISSGDEIESDGVYRQIWGEKQIAGSANSGEEELNGTLFEYDATLIIPSENDETPPGEGVKPSVGAAFPTKEIIPLKPNRTYKVTARYKSNFERASHEINIGMMLYESGEGSKAIMRDLVSTGVKAQTNGFEEFSYTFTTGQYVTSGKIYVGMYGWSEEELVDGIPTDVLMLTNRKVYEMKPVEREPLEKGEGMVFQGGAGNLDMKITGVIDGANSIVVTTTGTRYVFNRKQNTIDAWQLINEYRRVSSWKSSVPLENLEVFSRSDNEVVLVNDYLTFGVQLDGMLLISQQPSNDYPDLTLTLTSKIAGKWNRLSHGNLIAMDDIGGFTVNPILVNGTGELAQCEILTEDKIDFEKENDSRFLSSTEPDWRIRWKVRPGERFMITTFPPREYDWEKSFENANMSIGRGNVNSSLKRRLENFRDNNNVKIGILWNFYQRAYGMSYGNEFIPHDSNEFRNVVGVVKEAGLTPISYMSLNFWYNDNYDEYLAAVERQKTLYGVEGLYCDGIGYSNIIEKYETIRRLRELFADGVFYLHNTGKSYGMAGGPPVSVPDIFIPALETYADFVYKGENIPSNGKERDWEYVRYVASGYNTSNAIGRMKGDSWTDKSGEVIDDWEQKLYALELNCRNYFRSMSNIDNKGEGLYNSVEKKLKIAYEEWAEAGKSGDFYNDIYHPLATQLVDEALNSYKGHSEHEWSDWVVTKEATTTETGSKERVCNICGEKETETIPKKEKHTTHEWEKWVVTKEATTSATGLKERVCKICGEKQTETIPKKSPGGGGGGGGGRRRLIYFQLQDYY